VYLHLREKTKVKTAPTHRTAVMVNNNIKIFFFILILKCVPSQHLYRNTFTGGQPVHAENVPPLKLANTSVGSASSNQGPSSPNLLNAIVSDVHFKLGFVDLELVRVKCCVPVKIITWRGRKEIFLSENLWSEH